MRSAKDWKVDGPHFAGWEIYHLKGSPVDPNRIYASQTSAWFGQIIQRSDDGGKTWIQPGTAPGEPTTTPDGMPKGESNKFAYDASRKRQTANDPYVVRRHAASVGIQTGLASRTVVDRSESRFTPAWKMRRCSNQRTAARIGRNFPDCAATTPGPKWQPGAGGMCLHSILLDPKNPKRIFIAISAAGAFRTDDGGKTWKPINQRFAFAIHSRSERGGRPLRASYRDASIASEHASSCRNTGTSCEATMPAIHGAR